MGEEGGKGQSASATRRTAAASRRAKDECVWRRCHRLSHRDASAGAASPPRSPARPRSRARPRSTGLRARLWLLPLRTLAFSPQSHMKTRVATPRGASREARPEGGEEL